jgi:3-phosphoshikimate 1-carboxyvinyltransferase
MESKDARSQALELEPVRRAQGTVRLPGSKSISNRVLLLASLSQGTTEIAGLLDADDTRVMLAALRTLGIAFAEKESALHVTGAGGPFPVKQAELFLGNAGTAFRPLTAALGLSGGEYRLSGVPRMHERPIGDLVDGLKGIGARVDYLGAPGFPPLAIHPARISIEKSLRVRGDVSSQFLTALLMALPLLNRPSRIEVQGELISKPYVEITLNVMRRFALDVRRTGWKAFDLPKAQYTSPGKIFVEGDASSASYFLAAGAIGGGPVRVEGVGRDSIQGDVRFTEVLEKMGASVSFHENSIEVKSSGKKLRAIDMDMNHIPDAAMTAAVMALFADGPSTLRNIASWRVKETDRLAAMATELRKLGADVEEGKDFLKINPGKLKANAAIDTYDDHRMAMSFSLAALGGVPVRINDPGCVAKTFPRFFDEFKNISHG